jgi:HPt (histidine-containing phosphotransfer) domain-containing protein
LTDYRAKPVDEAPLVALLRGTGMPQIQEIFEAEQPAIDADRLAELRMISNEDTIARLLDLIVREASQRPQSIRHLLTMGDLSGAANVAHALFGAASNLGAARLAQAARAIEGAPSANEAMLSLSELDAAALALIDSLKSAPLSSLAVGSR